MNYLSNLWAKEPAMVVGTVVVILDAGLAIAVAYGVHVPDAVKVQIDVIGGAIITLLGAGTIRSQVTPVAAPKTP